MAYTIHVYLLTSELSTVRTKTLKMSDIVKFDHSICHICVKSPIANQVESVNLMKS